MFLLVICLSFPYEILFIGEDFDQATTLGDYVEVETLGQGGFGKVVLVQHKETKDRFAAKYVDARKYGKYLLLFLFIFIRLLKLTNFSSSF